MVINKYKFILEMINESIEHLEKEYISYRSKLMSDIMSIDKLNYSYSNGLWESTKKLQIELDLLKDLKEYIILVLGEP